MTIRMRKLLSVLTISLMPTVARAHPGDHGHFDMAEFLAHLLEWDHLGMASLVGLGAWLGFRLLRQRKASKA
jgi:hypothetical protein